MGHRIWIRKCQMWQMQHVGRCLCFSWCGKYGGSCGGNCGGNCGSCGGSFGKNDVGCLFFSTVDLATGCWGW